METILVKYILNECDEGEKLRVQEWLDKSPENRRLYEDYLTIWNQSKEAMPKLSTNTEDAWAKFKTNVVDAPIVSKRRTIPFYQTGVFRAAASLLFILVSIAGLRLYYYGNTEIIASGKVTKVALPDGSIVTLNDGAILSYPRHFRGTNRSMTLSGEGFFNVTKDPSHPFIVTTTSATIKVLGTSFNIKETESNVEVIVETGLVNVRSSKQNVNLKANESVIVNRTGVMKNKVVMEDSLYNYYRTNKFICNSTPLFKLISTLNEAYHVDIIVENKAALQIPLTTTFEKTQLDNILDVVCTTYGLQMKKNGDKIKLY